MQLSINLVCVSGVTSTSLAADTFTSTYKNYRLNVYLTTSANPGTLNFRFRAAGSDNTTTNFTYATQGLTANGGGVNINSAGAQNTFPLIYTTGSPNQTAFSLDIFNPKEAIQKHIIGTGLGTDNTATYYAGYRIGAIFGATTSFDSASLYMSSGTMTGSYSIYGYNA